MVNPYVRIRNISPIRRELKDAQLPGGRLVMEPGAETSIPREVYVRVARANAHWLLNLDSVTVQLDEGSVVPASDEGEPDTETFTCAGCGKQFGSKNGLSAHQRACKGKED